MFLRRSDAVNIMSVTKAKEALVASLQSMKFFKDCGTYADMDANKGDGDLFTIAQDLKFVSLSKYCIGSKLNVSWNEAKNELFSTKWNNDVEVLNEFVLSQFYRPLFFNPTNFKDFTTNSSAYQCNTTKWFLDHDGVRKQLKFTATWGEVNASASGITSVAGKYTIQADSVKYYPLTNAVEYKMDYNPIQVIDDKFVYDDVEFFVSYAESTQKATAVHFNKFVPDMFTTNHSAGITESDSGDRTFTLNGTKYIIRGDAVLVANTQKDAEDVDVDIGPSAYKYAVRHFSNDRFVLEGMMCVVGSDKVRFSRIDDNELKTIYLSTSGDKQIGRVDDMGLQFEFYRASGKNMVRLVRTYQSPIEDRV